MNTVRLHRVCRDHERRWRDLCVDRNLEDDWLARLNGLRLLRLINICEGHADPHPEYGRRSPHIIMRLREEWLPGLGQRWDTAKMIILGRVNDLFRLGDTEGTLEVTFRVRWGRGRLAYTEDLTFRIRGRQRRIGDEMESATRRWFEENVARLVALDDFLVELWPMAPTMAEPGDGPS